MSKCVSECSFSRQQSQASRRGANMDKRESCGNSVAFKQPHGTVRQQQTRGSFKGREGGLCDSDRLFSTRKSAM